MLSHLSLLAATLALASAQTSPLNCSTHVGGEGLGYGTDGSNPSFFGTIHGLNLFGPDNQTDPHIVTQYKNGTKFGSNSWDFLTCDYAKSYPPPIGYTYPSFNPVDLYFGILRPSGNNHSCLALSNRNIAHKGAESPFVLAKNCSAVPDLYRTFMLQYLVYGEGETAYGLWWAHEQETWLFGNGSHAEPLAATDYKGNKPGQPFVMNTGYVPMDCCDGCCGEKKNK